MTPEQITDVLRLHKLWLVGDARGKRADLREANLIGADLFKANLIGADLRGADLRGADLSRANLSGADLFGANLSGADLTGANLREANPSGANLSGAKGIIRVGPASDGHEFFGVQRDGVVWIKAGCRWFTAADARTHWQATRADTPLGAERLRFVDFIEAHFRPA